MLDYLSILRMHYSQNLSFREIGASVGCGKTAVGRFITRFEESEFTYPLPQNYSNEQIEAALYKKRGGAYFIRICTVERVKAVCLCRMQSC